MLSAIKAGIKAAKAQAATDNAARFKKALKESVADYLDNLPLDSAITVMARILGADGLTNAQVKRMIDAASTGVSVEIFFGNGDHAIISNRQPTERKGPGW